MIESTDPPPVRGGYRTVVAALGRLRRQSKHGNLTLGQVLDSLGEAGICVIALVLALPYLAPFIPLGPYSTAGALAMMLLGSQLLIGLRQPYLPRALRGVPVPAVLVRLAETAAIRLLGWLRRHTRRRFGHWLGPERNRWVVGGVLLSGGSIMVVPFFGIPFNDFFPALAIVAVCVAELEQDGLLVLAAFFWLAVGATYCGVLLTLVAWFGWAAIAAAFHIDVAG